VPIPIPIPIPIFPSMKKTKKMISYKKVQLAQEKKNKGAQCVHDGKLLCYYTKGLTNALFRLKIKTKQTYK